MDHGDAGAEYLASIFGTEKDKVNCSFYFKIGACRHGDKCSRIHNKPTYSQTLLITNLYRNPQLDESQGSAMDEHSNQRHYDEFYEEVFYEVETRYGDIEEMNVCDNLGDHLIGNVYIKFYKEDDATKAAEALNDRWFNGQPIQAELSPVTNFRESCCRQYEMGQCGRGGFCNFMHLRPISRDLRKKLYDRKSKRKSSNNRDRRRGGKSRSRSPKGNSGRRRSPRRRPRNEGGNHMHQDSQDLDWKLDF